MADEGARTTGNDALEGVDPGGTRSTKPGNADKSGAPDGKAAHDAQRIVSGDRNAGRPEEFSKDPSMQPPRN